MSRAWLAVVSAVVLLGVLPATEASGQIPQPVVPAFAKPPLGVRGRIVRSAARQLGYRDHWPFCTKFGSCELWCSLFATWTWRRAGVPIGSLAFTGSMYWWAALNTYVLRPKATPLPGDAVLFGTGPGSVGTSLHVGIVEDVYPRYLVTIEGDVAHQVRRFVVPIRHPRSIGEPGRIYAYASPVSRPRAAGLRTVARPIAPPALSKVRLRAAIAKQDPSGRRTRSGRLGAAIASLRAFQYMPYRAPKVRIGWTGVNSLGQVEVAVVARGVPGTAQLAWQRFLARYADSGTAYLVSYYDSAP